MPPFPPSPPTSPPAPVAFRGARLAVCWAALLLAGAAPAQIPAFPGAEGYGSHALGGRGGDVYIVSNLNASGAGSFADG
ncbi:MAG: hypothetical protein U1G05_19285, partial [Kiritimatiellia bacterium]